MSMNTLESGIGIRFEVRPAGKQSLYLVRVDGQVIMYTQNDDDGFKLMIAIARM